ncbi:pyridoxal-dependent decarboxylase [Proteus myxofaciens]|nr:pyridoxal-dependent decarboxylase [Proteus myxofaciens]
MANHKETCEGHAERVYSTRNANTHTCYHREMAKILMNSEHFFSKEKNQIESKDNIEVKLTNKPTDKQSIDDVYETILNSLKQQSCYHQSEIEPFFNHYNSHVMKLAKLGYLSALAYSSDNVFDNQSPLQKQQEEQIISDLCQLIGFTSKDAFGHITTSHIFACYEILWALRNLKTLPMAVARHPKSRDLIADKKAYELFNMPVATLLDISEQLHKRDIFDDVSYLTCRGTGMTRTMHLGKLLVPISRFEFWKKAMDIVGLGYDNLIALPIDKTFKTDITKTREIILRLIDQGEPILGVIGLLGSPIYGTIDKLKPLFELRKECEENYNYSFYIHIDASQLGYMKSLFLDDNYQIIPYKELNEKLKKEAPLLELQPDVYDSFVHLAHADSVSFEPFQAGFSPYPTGVLCIKDTRISYFLQNPPQICPEDRDAMQKIDGIQSAPAVASMWSVHQLYPFNFSGYGKLAQSQWETRVKLANLFEQSAPFEKNGIYYRIQVLPASDFNKLNFAVVIEGNHSLKIQNNLNQEIYENLVIKSYHKQDLNILTLCVRNCENVPVQFCRSCELAENEWKIVKHLSILQLTLKDAEKYDIDKIEAGYQYIKTVVLSALDNR